MIRMLFLFAVLLALAFGVVTLVETPGHVALTYGGFEYKVTLAKAVGLALAVIVATMVLWSVVRTLFRLPSLISMSNRMRRRSRGYAAVSRGLIAIGVGDRRAAKRFAGEAERFLGREPMTLLLKAQSSQLAGEKTEAEDAFRRMLDSDETRVLGLRGLYVEARRNGSDAARTFAEEAFRLAPAAPWAGEAVLEYRTADRNWRGAMAVVDENSSRRSIDRDTARRQKATLLAAEALELAERSPDEAFATASAALKANPGLVPAATLVARRHTARGDYSKATKVLETAWKEIQHPDLGEAYLGARPGDSSHDRLKRARALVRLTPGAREAKIVLAQALLDAREFAEARGELEALVLDSPTARVCRLMAELEDRESNNAAMVRKWLARASHAPRDPAWVADGFVSDHWAPVSPITGRIDAFVWMKPPQSLESSVRAAIDADRDTARIEDAIVALPAQAPAPIVAVTSTPAPEPVQPTTPEPPPPPPAIIAAPAPEPAAMPAATSAKGAAGAEPTDEADRAEARPVDPATGALVHLPDDPGPRLPGQPKKSGWRLFGE